MGLVPDRVSSLPHLLVYLFIGLTLKPTPRIDHPSRLTNSRPPSVLVTQKRCGRELPVSEVSSTSRAHQSTIKRKIIFLYILDTRTIFKFSNTLTRFIFDGQEVRGGCQGKTKSPLETAPLTKNHLSKPLDCPDWPKRGVNSTPVVPVESHWTPTLEYTGSRGPGRVSTDTGKEIRAHRSWSVQPRCRRLRLTTVTEVERLDVREVVRE